MKINKFVALMLTFAMLSACTLEPKYKRPQVDVPFADAVNPSKKKIAIISWEEFFTSSDLQRVIQLALDNNRDLRVADLNIKAAQGAYGVSRSNVLPTISAAASQTTQGVPSAFAGFMPQKQYKAALSLSAYELDFFGKMRSLKKSALAEFLATQEARNVTKIAVISETVNAYIQLVFDREMLDIAQKNLAIQNDRYRYVKLRHQNGIDSQDDVLNAKLLIENAKSTRETYQKLVDQDQNALMLLTGVFNRGTLPKNMRLDAIEVQESLLDLIPSKSLLFRPDIQQAEHQLKSANANIGAARAAFFPSITLTGTIGYGSGDLNSLFDSKTWNFTPQISIPIFSGGRNFANLTISQARQKIAIAQYEKTIQTAFREALDQLAERKSVIKQFQYFDQMLEACQKSYDISNSRYKVGINSALDVLDAKLALLTARQNKMMVEKEYLVNLIALYKVFGGGSKVEETVIEE